MLLPQSISGVMILSPILSFRNKIIYVTVKVERHRAISMAFLGAQFTEKDRNDNRLENIIFHRKYNQWRWYLHVLESNFAPHNKYTHTHTHSLIQHTCTQRTVFTIQYNAMEIVSNDNFRHFRHFWYFACCIMDVSIIFASVIILLRLTW